MASPDVPEGSEDTDDSRPDLNRTVEQKKSERDAVLEHLSKKWTKDRECPICGVSDWMIGDLAQLNLYAEWKQIYPVVPVVCKNCAYTHFFQAISIGIAPEA